VSDDDRLDPKILDAYEVPEPSPGAGDRFVAVVAATRARRRWPIAVAVTAMAAAVVAVVVIGRVHEPIVGTASTTARTTIELGSRAVAVAEVGSHIVWNIDGDARIEQPTGNVFYRVEPGGAFVVATPAGDVTVHGTCFRVDLETGASLAVTVYEGTVTVSNRFGHVDAHAGDTAAATPATTPRLAPATVIASAPTSLTIGELLARDHVQRGRIAELEAKLGEHDVALSQRTRPFEMSHAELVELAQRCSVPFDIPPIIGSPIVEKLLDDGMTKIHFDDAERAAVQRIAARRQPAYTAALQALYHDVTGDDTNALDLVTLMVEIPQKSTPEDVPFAHRIVSEERAGLRTPSDPATGSVMERYLRQGIAASDGFERELAGEIGASRAREFRRTWGMVNFEPGCQVR